MVITYSRLRLSIHGSSFHCFIDNILYIYYIYCVIFDWDPKKANSNERKHKISFEEAKSAFFDPEALLLPDEKHSEIEERFILLGMSSRLKLLVVVHAYKESEGSIRLISARKANRLERGQYEKRLQ